MVLYKAFWWSTVIRVGVDMCHLPDSTYIVMTTVVLMQHQPTPSSIKHWSVLAWVVGYKRSLSASLSKSGRRVVCILVSGWSNRHRIEINCVHQTYSTPLPQGENVGYISDNETMIRILTGIIHIIDSTQFLWGGVSWAVLSSKYCRVIACWWRMSLTIYKEGITIRLIFNSSEIKDTILHLSN